MNKMVILIMKDIRNTTLMIDIRNTTIMIETLVLKITDILAMIIIEENLLENRQKNYCKKKKRKPQKHRQLLTG